MHILQKVNPINKDQERERFLFDPYYNPQFRYELDIEPPQLHKYGAVSDEFLDVALHIIRSVIKKYKSEAEYFAQVEGHILNQEQVATAIEQYLERLGLAKSMNVRYSRGFIARTSVYKHTINVRLPIEHRQKSLQSTLDHEIGTHYLKTLNDEKQPWFQSRKEFGLRDYLETEEGLAVIHYYLSMEVKYLWMQAIYYYAVIQAESMSFSELFFHLEPYVQSKERRWKICLRVKRGMKDTSVPGAFTKDQVYLKGVIRVAKWLQKNNFDPKPLYVGKVDLLDLPKVKKIMKNEGLRFPAFLEENQVYVGSLQELIKLNQLPI